MGNRIILCLGIIIVAMLLTACGPNSSQTVGKSEELVKAFITAYETKNTKQYLALFDKDAIYMAQGDPGMRSVGEMYVRNLTTPIAETFNEPTFQVKFESYFISVDGAKAALTTIYTNKDSTGNPTSVPMVIILEIRDGKIVREDDYYDFTPFEK